MSARQRPIVAIDGPAGAGKSTVAKAVCERLGYVYVDTGAMYRAVALGCIRRGVEIEDEQAASEIAAGIGIEFAPADNGGQLTLMDGVDVSRAIREHEVSDAASRVSAHPRVREQMVARQREMGQCGGVVMEGRDIQTNVFPDAEVKVYLRASIEERARRRARDLRERGLDVPSREELERSIAERDERDATRGTAPMAAADDAVIIDTDDLTIEQVVETVVVLVRQRQGEASDG